jgi:succinate dehydrogenase/fumarate reductase flavoprotein subunit
MAKQRVLIVGGGLAGLAAAMKLAEDGVDVDMMSLVPVKRSRLRSGRHQLGQRSHPPRRRQRVAAF